MQNLQKTQSSAKITTQLQSLQKTRRWDFPSVSGTQVTSTTLQTLGLEHANYADYTIHNKLPYLVNKYSFNYDGSGHASWSRNLNSLYKKTKIPTAKIEEYTALLTKHIETIKHWHVENALNTFTLLSRIGFFNQLNNLTIHKEEVIALRNELTNKINERLQDIPINEANAIRHVCLLRSVYDQMSHDKCLSSISEELLKQTYLSLMSAEDPLPSYHYKEILQTLTEIGNQASKYIPLFKPLIYKHLDCMANIEINTENEINFLTYLSGITNLTVQNFPLEGKDKKNVIQLINKIKFTRDNMMAVLGLKSLTTLVDKNKLSLVDVEHKINECIDFIQGKKLELYQISFFLVSISKYIQASRTLPNNLKKTIEQYLAILVAHKDTLPIETLQAILKTLRMLISFNHPVTTTLQQISEVLDKNKMNFLKLSPREVHGAITNLTRVLLQTKNEFNVHLLAEFTNFLTILLPKYLETVVSTSLNEIVNGFTTLSDLIDSGYLANIQMKATLNELLSKIDSDIHLLSQKQRIYFFRVICLKYNLFSLDDDKTIKYAYKLLEFSASEAKIQELSESAKSIILLCMLVFYEANYEKFSKRLLDKFKETIISLYEALDKEKKSNKLTSSQSISYIFAANLLGYKVKDPFVQNATAFINDVQTGCLRTLQAKFDELHFEEEQSINGLPPCDIVEHNKKIAIEVQGMYHFLDKDRTLTNGTTILKNTLLRKNDYHVIEIKVKDGKISDMEIKTCFRRIEKILGKSSVLQKVNF